MRWSKAALSSLPPDRAMTTSIIIWSICGLLAAGIGWSRHEKKKMRDKFLRELIAMDPVRREKVLSRLSPELQMDLRRQLMERYRISSIQSGLN